MFPVSGRILPEYPDDPFREVIVGPYRVIYRYLPERNIVAVLAVSHGSSLLRRPTDDI
jgi:toxin ParE1/3/4